MSINLYSIFNNFDPSNLISFLIGVITGIAFLFLVLVLLTVKGKKEATKIYKPTIKDYNDEKVQEIITKKQEQFLYEIEENDKEFLKTIFNISLDLLHEIAKYYYPDSKYPEYELTFEEASDLIHYIVNKLMSIFDKPVLKKFKNMRISFIKFSIDKGTKIKNSKAVKAVKESGADEVVSATRTILNTLNPVYWIKKVLIQGTLNITLKKIGKAGISIIGEESNKVYSKNLFDNQGVSEKTINDIEEIYSDEA